MIPAPFTPLPSSMSFYDVKSQLARFIQTRSEEAFARGEATRDAVQTVAELEAYQAHARQRFLAAMGGLPASAPSLDARTTGTFTGPGYHGENVMFTSRPGVHVTANLYLPASHTGPGGAVLFLCGHAHEGKHYPAYLNVCLHLVRAGLVVLAMDPTGQGERLSFPGPIDRDPTIDHPVWEHSFIGCRCLPLGQSFIRYFVHDAMRAIDYLATRTEVDPARIGVTGSSGGGTQTCTLMLAEPRIAAAAPVNFLTSRRAYLYAGGAQDAEQIWTGFTADGFDHENFLIGMAPRPVLVGAADSDFFPIEGTRASVARSRRFWQLHHAEDRLQLFVDHAPHAYTNTLARHVAAFFALQLNGTVVEPDSAPQRPPEVAAMRVTATGQVMTAVAGARDAIDDHLARLDELAARRQALDDPARRDRALDWLRRVVSTSRDPVDANPRCYATGHWHDLTVAKYLWWTLPGLMNHAVRFQVNKQTVPEGGWPVTLALWEGGTVDWERHGAWIHQTCEQGRSVWVLDVSGTGELDPHPITARPQRELYGTIYRLADDLIWLNDSLVALRVHDLLRALAVIPGLDGCSATDVHVHARDREGGLYARLAAVLDPRVAHLECVDGLSSFDRWLRPRSYDDRNIKELILPGVLEHFDLPDIDRWLGPRLASAPS